MVTLRLCQRKFCSKCIDGQFQESSALNQKSSALLWGQRKGLSDTQVVSDRHNEFPGRRLSLLPESVPLARIGSRDAGCLRHLPGLIGQTVAEPRNFEWADYGQPPLLRHQIEQDVLNSRVVNFG
jgi:hypothetical protein